MNRTILLFVMLIILGCGIAFVGFGQFVLMSYHLKSNKHKNKEDGEKTRPESIYELFAETPTRPALTVGMMIFGAVVVVGGGFMIIKEMTKSPE